MTDFKKIAQKLAKKKVESAKDFEDLISLEGEDVSSSPQGKRKVITGGKVWSDDSGPKIGSLKDRLGQGVDDAGGILDDTDVKGASDKFDQYTKTQSTIDPVSGKKTVKALTPAEVVEIDPGRKIFDFEKKSEQTPTQEKKQTSREARSESTRKLLGDYEEARRQSGFRSNMAASRAMTMAISNPAAAQAYLQAKKGYINEPTEAIEGGYRTAQDSNKVEGQNIDLAAQDELDNASSDISVQSRRVLKEQFGMQVPETVTARAIKQMFPMIRVDTQRDTSQRGQDYTFKTNEENRKSRESEGSKNRFSRKGIAEENRKAGIGKVIIGGAMSQDAATRKGASDSTQKTANSATLPDSFSGKSFLVTKKGVPPSPERAKQVQTLGIEAARYVSVLKELENLINQAQGRPQFFDENWPTVKAKYAQASQRNVKFNGNGVTNGPDLEQALKQIGDPTSAINWLRGAGKQIIQNASKSAMDQYYVGADAAGFERSNKPSEMTQTMGTGGSSATQKPVNPALASGANEAASRFGFGPVVETAPAPSPGTPGVKKSTFRFVPGKGFVKVGE